MSVSIIKTDRQSVREALPEALKLIEYSPAKYKVIIKPNIVGPMSVDSQVVTDLVVVDAVVDYFRGFTDEIYIAESSSIGYDTMYSFEVSGYRKWAEENGVGLIDLRGEKTLDIDWEFGTIKIPEILFGSEFVNLPKMKTHNQTGISICMKNLKGVLRDEDKMMFHRQGLMGHIGALADVVRPDLNVVDAICAMEGEGPGRSGQRKDMGLILAGRDSREVDRVCLEIMGFDLSVAPYIPDMEYATLGVPLEEVRTDFICPTGHYQRMNCHVWMGNTCSGCVFQLADAMHRLKRRPLKAFSVVVKSLKGPTHLITGSGMEPGIEKGRIICIGSCSRDAARSLGADYVRGCPPSCDDILDRL
jgi:uncharacterized protein (DUF362 family)